MLKHASVLGFFSFIETPAWIKLFLLQLTMTTTTIIKYQGATCFLKTIQRRFLKEVNWSNTHGKTCPYYKEKKIVFHIACIVLPVLCSTSDNHYIYEIVFTFSLYLYHVYTENL